MKKRQTTAVRRYYHSDAWHALCQVVYARDKGRCVLCNRPGVQYHHRSYDFFGMGAESPEVHDVHLLCKRCHALFHKSAKTTHTRWTLADMEPTASGAYQRRTT